MAKLGETVYSSAFGSNKPKEVTEEKVQQAVEQGNADLAKQVADLTNLVAQLLQNQAKPVEEAKEVEVKEPAKTGSKTKAKADDAAE